MYTGTKNQFIIPTYTPMPQHIPTIAVFLDGTKKNCLSPRQLALCKTAKVNKPIYILYL